ncbi:hypothetical protein [Acinetobacter baumannii]|uniref:hypothetical protein n=1 Tax=Acinetobacter baumannii TaxID=470 RepID=UPI00041563F2|nr:hypothetical protein [Acinetobacter baumannii]
MSNAEDLLEALIKALKESNVDAEELRFMTLLPDHMRKIQDLTEEFVKAHVEPYRVCRRVNILRDYPDDKTKLYPRN